MSGTRTMMRLAYRKIKSPAVELLQSYENHTQCIITAKDMPSLEYQTQLYLQCQYRPDICTQYLSQAFAVPVSEGNSLQRQ